jgi:hypothetical protein
MGSIGTNNPTYQWDEVADATWYYLWVDGPSGKVFDKWYTIAQAGCNGTACSVTNATPNLGAGTYTWRVQTWNERDFALANPLPDQPTLIGPNNSTTDLTPNFTWNAVSSETGSPATWYYLWIDGPSGKVLDKWYTAAEAGMQALVHGVVA